MNFGITLQQNGMIGPIDPDTLRPDVRYMYLKYQELFTFRVLSDDAESIKRKYYVYEWFTKDNGKVFYVGKGTGDRWKHVLIEAENGHRPWYKILQERFGIDYRYVLQDLTGYEAEIYEVCWINERSSQGEVLLQFADMPFNLQEHEARKMSYRNRTFQPKIEVDGFNRRYIGVDKEPDFDKVDGQALLYAHFLYTSTLFEPECNPEKERIRSFIINKGGRVFNSLAKGAKSAIEFGILQYESYHELKKQGYLVFHSFHVIQFIEEYGETLSEIKNIKPKTSIPKYDNAIKTDIESFLESLRPELPEIANSIRNNLLDSELQAIDYEHSGDFKNAIKLLEACLLDEFFMPMVFERLMIMYRKFGMFTEELRIVELYLKNVSVDSDKIQTRKNNLIDIIKKDTEVHR